MKNAEKLWFICIIASRILIRDVMWNTQYVEVLPNQVRYLEIIFITFDSKHIPNKTENHVGDVLAVSQIFTKLLD